MTGWSGRSADVMAQPSAITFCLMVPSGSWDLDSLVGAIRTFHADADVVAVWCGDPHRRPVLPQGVRWADIDLADASGVGWGVSLVALESRAYEWRRTASAVDRLLDGGTTAVIVLRAGSVAVLGPLDELISATSPVSLVPRSSGSFAADGFAPTETDLAIVGHHSITVAGFSSDGRDALGWLSSNLAEDTLEVGPLMDRMAELHDGRNAPPSVLAVGWTDPAGPVSLVDLDQLDRDEPWRLSFAGRPARVRLSEQPAVAAAVAAGLPQTAGEASAIELPGSIPVVGAVRAAVRTALRVGSDLPREPFGPHNSDFMSWLEHAEPWAADIGRYWLALREQRGDLQTIFAQPQSLDADRFRDWVDASWRLEPERTALLRASGTTRSPIVDVGRELDGVNILGYFDFDQSQGHIAREIAAALVAADVPVTRLNHARSLGSPRTDRLDAPREARFATNLVVVNPDQFDFVVADHGATLLDRRRTIGYWFWELEDVPSTFQPAIDAVDEIWTGSQFIADAFARVTDKPVRCVPLPMAEPKPSDRGRDTMGVPDDAYVFLTTFDQFSVPERKNPFGVIDAFTRAFAHGEGPVLLIKTMNGAKSWRNHERLLLAVAGRSDIVMWDEHLSRPDQMAVVAAADCLVSLHRSEGLGLHCAEAMWLGKPVIATAYSGNLDFMDDTVAAMIPYELTPVRHGEGIYPETAFWADPDLEQAAQWMRRLVDDPSIGIELGHRARARMRQQPTTAETGRRMAALAGIDGHHEGQPRAGGR
ncbi:MAG: putative glycosyltransferase [Ilumatobacteraceae bacterium]|nr:putative glycosyltransferase [Ilumatobacteraceae bacterium]